MVAGDILIDRDRGRTSHFYPTLVLTVHTYVFVFTYASFFYVVRCLSMRASCKGRVHSTVLGPCESGYFAAVCVLLFPPPPPLPLPSHPPLLVVI